MTSTAYCDSVAHEQHCINALPEKNRKQTLATYMCILKDG